MKRLVIYSLLFSSLALFGGTFSKNSHFAPATAHAQYEYNPKDIAESGIISCYNKCEFNDVLRTLNNIIYFLITTLFIPVVVIMCMFAGYKYLTAQGDPKKIVSVKGMLKNLLIGILIILCAWLIVKTVLSTVVSDEGGVLQFFQ